MHSRDQQRQQSSVWGGGGDLTKIQIVGSPSQVPRSGRDARSRRISFLCLSVSSVCVSLRPLHQR